MAKILIYGGSGIISTEIVKSAISRGHSVTMVNRGKRKMFIHPNADCIVADMRKETVEALKQKITGQYDTVMDFLSYTTEELARNMEIVKGKCSQYLFVSSATVYNSKIGRYQEDDPIGDNLWDYARIKANCEKMLIQSAQENGFAYTIVRPYITYGKTRIPMQFAPLEYYTIIHRMKNHKPLPVNERDVNCTLTWSSNFAVAAVGLIQNEKAFNEAFHITGDYETTWNRALEIEAEAFGVTCDVVRLSDEKFQNKKLMYGLNAVEVIGDKGRDMLFDNSKIKAVVPAFTGDSKLEDVIPEIVAYFENNISARNVNYVWDARCDRMLAHSKLLSKDQKQTLHFCANEQSTIKDYFIYTINRHTVSLYCLEICKKIINVVRKCISK